MYAVHTEPGTKANDVINVFMLITRPNDIFGIVASLKHSIKLISPVDFCALICY